MVHCLILKWCKYMNSRNMPSHLIRLFQLGIVHIEAVEIVICNGMQFKWFFFYKKKEFSSQMGEDTLYCERV